MRQYENILDQQNAQKAAARLHKFNQSEAEQDLNKAVYVRKRQPEITPENKSNETSRATVERDFERICDQVQLRQKFKGQTIQHASAEQAIYHPLDNKATI